MPSPVVLRMLDAIQARIDGGILTGGAPMPKTAAGLGQWRLLRAGWSSSAGYTLVFPTGGTWAYMREGLDESGIVPGGTSISSGPGGHALIWRIA